MDTIVYNSVELEHIISSPGEQGPPGPTVTKEMLGLENVTNESKATMFNNPTFTGIATSDIFKLSGGVGTQGEISWNPNEETLDVVQNGAVLQLGQEMQTHVRNNTGSTILNGMCVMATGSLGNSGRISIAPMIGNGSIESKYFIGVATEDIIAGDDGKVTVFGKVRGIKTDGYGTTGTEGVDYEIWNDGEVLWVHPTIPGGFTKHAPTAPKTKLAAAFVLSAHGNNGTIMVRANEGSSLHESHDVEITNVSSNDLLQYNSTLNRWENKSVAILKGISTAIGDPPDNSSLSFTLLSNSQLQIKVRGTDGVIRSTTLNLI